MEKLKITSLFGQCLICLSAIAPLFLFGTEPDQSWFEARL